MTVPNPNFNDGRKGLLCDLEDVLERDITPTSNSADAFNLGYGNIPDNFYIQPGAENGELQLELIHNEATDRTILLALSGFTLSYFEVLSGSVEYLGSHLIFETWNLRNRAKGEIEAQNASTSIRVAMSIPTQTFESGVDYIQSIMHFWILDLAEPGIPIVEETHEVLVDRAPLSPFPLNAQGDPVWYPFIGGVEFSPSGDRTYMLNSYASTSGPNGVTNYLSYWDWSDQSIHFVDGTDQLPFVDSKMELATGPDGTGQALYVSGTTAQGDHFLGALVGPDDPQTASWLPTAVELSGVSLCEDRSLAQLYPEFDRYNLLPKQNAGDQTSAMLNGDACCTVVNAMLSYGDQIIGAGNATWTTTDNPFRDHPIIRVSSELRFESGAFITAHDLEFRFGPNAVLTIEEGAQFNCFDCTFINTCPETMWKGIRVEGDRYDPMQDDTHQGQLRLFQSTVAGARTGVWCAREVAPGVAHPSYGGGAVRAYDCTFRNCIVGARVEGYHRFDAQDVELPNISYFTDCVFETTDTWTTDNSPNAQLYLRDVSGIAVERSTFRNTAQDLFDLQQRGYGIFSLDAGFRCSGFSEYSTSSFAGLTAGVVASVPDPAKTYIVDGMGFFDNEQGVVDFGSTDARITNNQFVLRGSATESSTASVGIQLFQSERYTIERNTFTDQGGNVPSVGIWFSGPAFEANRIYDNDFKDMNIGTLVEGRHRADNGVPQTDPGLQLLCGDHEGNAADQFILQEGYLQYFQGQPVNGNVTANNIFRSQVDCSSEGAGPSYHIGFWAWSDYGMDARYHYYDNASSPGMRPDCIEDGNGDPISFIGDWFYDLQDVAVADPFDREVHCSGGVLDQIEGPGIGGVVELAELYRLRQGEFA